MTRPRNQVLDFELALTGTRHELKTWPKFYDAVAEGSKPFELRRDDRPGGFRIGDTLILREWQPAVLGVPRLQPGYTGRELERVVTYVLRGGATATLAPRERFDDGSDAPPLFPVAHGWAVLGLALPPAAG